MTEEVFIISEVNCETGVQVDRPMTEDEIAAYQQMRAESARLLAEEEAAIQAKAAAKASAEAKLAALGLTPEEIAAL